MRISRVKLENWKNFRHAEADLLHRVFIVGANASGKSNFLDALRFLRDVAKAGLRDAVRDRGGVTALRCLAARGSRGNGLAIEVHLADSEGRDIWRYRLAFSQDAAKTPRVKEEIVDSLADGRSILHRPDEDDQGDDERLTQTALEQINANRDFREIANFFQSISFQHVVPQVVRDPSGFSAVPVQDDPFGRDLLVRIWRTPTRQRDAWLKRISEVLRLAVPQLERLEVEIDAQGTAHLVGRYDHWREHSGTQTEAQFSDGTLRLFGLLWSMFEGSGPLLLEEPELSLHPEVVAKLPQLLLQVFDEIRKMKKKGSPDESRQVLISTHSFEMMNDPGIDADEVLLVIPDPEGSVLRTPTAEDRQALAAGLTPAEVILPRTAPTELQRLKLAY